MLASSIPASRSARRAQLTRAQRITSFARVWRRALPVGAALALSLTPGVLRPASAISAGPSHSAFYQTTETDGNYSTSGNFRDGNSTATTARPATSGTATAWAAAA